MEEDRSARRWRTPPALSFALLALVTIAGGVLRLDALSARYGWLDHPQWASRVERAAVRFSRPVLPESVWWGRVDKPYVGGDPINYLRFAREMRHFYQAHVREPVFLAVTRAMLWVMDGSDIAISYASWLGGTLAIPATYLLGAAAHSPAAGLVAAGALAIELDAIVWAADGWRDDTFMLFVALCGWAFLRLQQQPTLRRGTIAGVVAGGACLTRISSLSFIIPALIWIAAGGRRSGPALARMRAAALAAGVTALLIAPFLVNCWRATGDPLFAINYHTRYYRAAEGLPSEESVSAVAFVSRKLQARPVATIDTAGVGLFVFPFVNKWSGLAPWSPQLAAALRWLAAAGLVLALWSSEGRLLWLLLLTSLVPYALTWSLGGGGEWRFTQHVYPFYLVAAGATLGAAARAIKRLPHWRGGVAPLLVRRRVAAAVACGLALALGIAVYRVLPYFVVREALAAGESVSIHVNDRDDAFFSGRWSGIAGSGNVHVRVAMDERLSVRIPVPLPVAHTLTLRMDGPEVQDPAYQPRVTVFFEQRTIGQVRFANDPTRVGTYRVTIPQDLAGRTFGRLDFVASHTVRADQAGPRFAWLPRDAPVAFYLWYLRLEPHLPPRTADSRRQVSAADSEGDVLHAIP